MGWLGTTWVENRWGPSRLAWAAQICVAQPGGRWGWAPSVHRSQASPAPPVAILGRVFFFI